MSKFLDLSGLSYLWDKIATRINAKADIIHTMLGQHNVADPNDDYLLMVGNGTDENNPLTVFSIDKNGNVVVDPGTLSAENILGTLLSMMSSTIDRGNPGSSDIYGGSGVLKLVDINGVQIGYLQPIQLSNGKEGIQLGVGNSDNSDFTTLEIGFDANDDPYVTVTDPAAWRNAINTINKNGDTMTGTLTAQGTFFTAQSTNIDRDGTAPSSTTRCDSRFFMRDKDGEFIGQMRISQDSAGMMILELMVGNENTSNSEVTNTIAIRVAKDGTQSYSVSNSENFRSAISAQVKPTVLYNNTTGTNGTVTLSASAANYNHMRIYYHFKNNNGDQIIYGSTDVYSPSGKKFDMRITSAANSTFYIYHGWGSISGTSISKNQNGYGWVTSSSQGLSTSDNHIYIVRVEAWNE